MAGPIPLPPPVPPMYLRFTISAAFSTLALTLLPFFLVGMLLRCVFAPLTSMYEAMTAPRKRSRKPKANKAATSTATGAPTGAPGLSSRRIPTAHTAAQAYASSARLSPPSPASSISSASSNSRPRA